MVIQHGLVALRPPSVAFRFGRGSALKIGGQARRCADRGDRDWSPARTLGYDLDIPGGDPVTVRSLML